MNLFGNKKGMILLVFAAVCLFAFVVWPFVKGDRSMIQTEFLPMNAQMQEMISQVEEEPNPEVKPTKKPDSKSTLDTDSKFAKNSMQPFAETSIPPAAQQLTTQPSITQPEASSSDAPSAGQLDLNTATLEQLNELPGIGESKARAILDYRIKKGRFKQIDELTEVKGIGEKMLAKLKAFLYVTTS